MEWLRIQVADIVLATPCERFDAVLATPAPRRNADRLVVPSRPAENSSRPLQPMRLRPAHHVQRPMPGVRARRHAERMSRDEATGTLAEVDEAVGRCACAVILAAWGVGLVYGISVPASDHLTIISSTGRLRFSGSDRPRLTPGSLAVAAIHPNYRSLGLDWPMWERAHGGYYFMVPYWCLLLHRDADRAAVLSRPAEIPSRPLQPVRLRPAHHDQRPLPGVRAPPAAKG